MAALTHQKLREALDYNPGTGVFVRKETTSFNPKVKVGGVAGFQYSNGYLGIRVGGKRYLAHRLAWFYSTGSWPVGELDHINGKRDDNRIENLRVATRSLNMANIHAPSKSKSGVRGVCFDKATGRWIAHLQLNGKFKNLGRFDSIDAASAARQEAHQKAFGLHSGYSTV